MELLREFSRIRLLREFGKTNKINLDAFFNARRRYTYIFLSKQNKYPLEYSPSLESLENEFVQTTNSNLPVGVFEQLVFSVIKLFHFSKRYNIVNQRLSFFLFFSICSSKRGKEKDQMFTSMLYFLQNSESFLDRVKLIDNQICYEGQVINIVDYSNNYFDFSIQNRFKLEDGEDFTVFELQQLKKFIGQFFSAILNVTELNEHIFSLGTFFDKYEKDKASFFNELSDCLDSYRLESMDDSDHNTSLFLNSKIEGFKLLKSNRRLLRKRKVYSEYFVDSYILHFFDAETFFVDIDYLSSEKSQFLKNVLQSHSFVRMDIDKKRILDSF